MSGKQNLQVIDKENSMVLKKLLRRATLLIKQGIYRINPKTKQKIVDDFHNLYYDAGLTGGTWAKNKYLGVPIQKCPMDLFAYQEIIYETKPDVIIEAGTAYGGSAYFMANLCDVIGKGEIITIDITDFKTLPKHKRITSLLGSSVSSKVVKKVKKLIRDKKSVMVILDSKHTKDHVLKELDIYSNLVTKGNYLVVEDSNVNGHPVRPEHGPGPYEALTEFLKNNSGFEIHKERERAFLTFNPNGYLKKIK
jgi:cephalosporin hydroxylase